MAYDLSRLDERRFEDLCRALAVHALGAGLQVFGAGPDGGREAAFDGPVPYPTTADGWNGYGVVQAKCRQHSHGKDDAQWLHRTIVRELDQWDDPNRKRVSDGRRPEYLIIATNVRLTSVARRGGIDRIRTLLAGYADRLSLKGWDLWDANKLSAYLDAYPNVARRFAEFLTSGQVLTKALDTIDDVRTALTAGTFTVGQGQPGCRRAFDKAYQAAGGAAGLGEFCSEVYDDGPGWVQHLTGPHGDPPGAAVSGEAVVCAGFGQPAVVVTAELWDAIRAAGGRDQLTAVGYPVVTADTPPLLSTDESEILLDGGDWNAGRLVREQSGTWRWKEQVAFSFEVGTRDWHTAGEPMDLRLRCTATMRWADIDGLSIDGTGRRRVVAALRAGPLDGVARALAARFALDPTTGWERTPNGEGYNDRRFASYRLTFPGVQGRPALGLWARFQLPDGLRDTIVSMADLRVDFSALPGYVAEPGEPPVEPGHRLDPAVLHRCLVAAWLTATQAMPLAATAQPSAAAAAGPSRVEVHLSTERPWASHPGGRVVGVLDLLDLADWGHPPEQPRPWMSATVTTPMDLTDVEVDDLVEQTLRYLASGFGFLDSDEDD
ncbi:hypothetical protein [Virgisporangium aurantiacum]|uniref:Uncharacterized protein n=1 Tax=Virgisporangium aurantiacum TaxID=175570 RepID=A0A8J3ZNI1_9ACTN|nr:hypothetical protein [Virgisporangium aurantiacum]GIJ64791.1 hypothetical protein Vau01_123070 [Virgisporangium aurantiacum]